MADDSIHIIESVIEITKHRDRDLIGNSLARTLAEQIPCKKITLYHLQKRTHPVVLSEGACVDASGNVYAADRETVLSAPLSQGIMDCLTTGEPAEVRNPHENIVETIYPVFRKQGEIIGFLIVLHDGANVDQKRLVEGFLKILQNFLALLDESQSDKLTGLLNRQTFDEQILKVISNPINRTAYVHLYAGTGRRIPDETFSYWLAIIDVDDFKKVNDVFGHVFGDEVLILIARLMQSSFRYDDPLFRYGGEEFIVVMKAPAQREADIGLERFRQKVEAYSFPRIGRVTVSIGYVQISSSDAPVVALGRADAALYCAKKSGRNKTCNYEQLIARGELQEADVRYGPIELFRYPSPNSGGEGNLPKDTRIKDIVTPDESPDL
jgi:two-component system cell cycle response regulator